MGDGQGLEPRLNSIEIKVTLAQGAMERALNKLGLDPRECLTRRIFFCEAQAGLELLERKIILRLRETAGKGDDSTVKLRPFDARKLSTDWQEKKEVEGGKFRIEGDWAGQRRVVAASVVVDQQQGEVAQAARGGRPINKLFSDEQEDFLRKHTPKPVDLSALRMLGPINARKWEPSEHGFPSALAAEHWKVDELSTNALEPELTAAQCRAKWSWMMHSRQYPGDVERGVPVGHPLVGRWSPR